MIKEGVVKIGKTPCVNTGKPCDCINKKTREAMTKEASSDNTSIEDLGITLFEEIPDELNK